MGRVGKSPKDVLSLQGPPPGEPRCGGGPLKSEPTSWVFGGQIAKHPQSLTSPAAVRACPVFFMVEFSPLPEAPLGVNVMGVSMAGPEGLWWAGGHVAGRRAPTHFCRSTPHGHRPAQSPPGCGCGRMCRGPVQPMQVSDHRAVSVECSQGALAVLAPSREGHVSVVPLMTGRSAAAPPTQPHCYHKKQEATPCR